MHYDWVVFDADETLFTFDGKAGLQQLLAQHNVPWHEDHFDDFARVNKPLWYAFQRGEISAQDIKEQRFVGWDERLGLSSFELNRRFMSIMAEICEPIDGAKALLDSLHGKAKMGIITNGFTELQQERLDAHGFSHFFDFIVVSEEEGLAKPDPAIFHLAERQHMQHPERESVLMVGDNLHSDVLGGQRAGWHTCWFQRQPEPVPEDITPTLTVSHLSELQRALV